jgi:UDP-glucose:(heptosyl)LPS alpha-1,3-glucosyltransferase
MKFGLVRRGYSESGGAEAFLRRFAAELAAQQHQVVLFTTRDWPGAAWDYDMVQLSGSMNPVRFAQSVQRARARGKCDVLFSFERLHACDCYRAGDGVHRVWLERRAPFEPWLKVLFRNFNGKHRDLLRLERRLFRAGGAEITIANSHMVKKEIVATYAYPAERIHVVHNGLPASALTAPTAAARAEGRHALGLPDSTYLVLFAGTGFTRKGLRWAMQAMEVANVPDSMLVVAGRGNPEALPESTRTIFLGGVRDLPRYLAAADAFILPTIYDPFSNACLEALAAGLPVITTACNGFAEILEPGVEGHVVSRPDDVPALAAAIEHWSDPDRRAAARPRLLEKAQRFTIEENVRQTLAAIDGSFNGRG